MNIAILKTIAEIAEEKRVRIELLPEGFRITARAPVMGKGMVETKQIIMYDACSEANYIIGLFETAIDEAIESLKLESRKR